MGEWASKGLTNHSTHYDPTNSVKRYEMQGVAYMKNILSEPMT